MTLSNGFMGFKTTLVDLKTMKTGMLLSISVQQTATPVTFSEVCLDLHFTVLESHE